MMKKSIEKALSAHLNEELRSSYIYFAMTAFFESKNLNGMANWMRIQTEEELLHMKKFYDHIISRGGAVRFETIEAPQMTWKSPLAVFEAALKHEQHITGRIHALVDLAGKEKDHAAAAFLLWFVSEQVEEEANADDVVQRLRLAGDSPSTIFLIDKELAARTLPAPPAGE